MVSIIFVDDMPESTDKAQAAFRAVCDRHGISCAITSTTTAESFLACVAKHDYDVYVIDIELPETRGDRLVRAVRGINPLATIAFLSFHVGHGNIAVQLNVDAYLYKVYEMREMQRQVEILLKKCASKRQHYRFHTATDVVDIAVNDILYIASYHRNVYVHMRDGTVHNVYHVTLTGLQEQPHFFQFEKISRSLLVNADAVTEVNWKANAMWLSNGERLRCSSSARRKIIEKMSEADQRDGHEMSDTEVDTLRK